MRTVSQATQVGNRRGYVRLRENAIHFSPADYEQLYRQFPRIHEETDNTQACLDRIVHDVVPGKICDVGCGTGLLLKYIRERRGADGLDLTGVDFVIDSKTKSIEGIIWQDANIEALPFGDQSFYTVVCTHSLEYILDFRKAVAKLRRIEANENRELRPPRAPGSSACGRSPELGGVAAFPAYAGGH